MLSAAVKKITGPELLRHIRANDQKAVQSAFNGLSPDEAKALVNYTSPQFSEDNPLIAAITLKFIDIALFLLTIDGIDVNMFDSNKSSALVLAAFHGLKPVYEALMQRPETDYNALNYKNVSALIKLIEQDPETAKKMVEDEKRLSPVTLTTISEKVNPLLCALWYQATPVVLALLKRGVPLPAENEMAALRRHPTHINTHFIIHTFVLYKQVCENYTPAQADKRAELEGHIGGFYLDVQDYREAEKWLRKSLQTTHCLQVSAMTNYGWIAWLERRSIKEALPLMQAAYFLPPLTNAGEKVLTEVKKQKKQIIPLLEKMLTTSVPDEKLPAAEDQAALHLTLAAIYHAGKDQTKAIEYFDAVKTQENEFLQKGLEYLLFPGRTDLSYCQNKEIKLHGDFAISGLLFLMHAVQQGSALAGHLIELYSENPDILVKMAACSMLVDLADNPRVSFAWHPERLAAAREKLAAPENKEFCTVVGLVYGLRKTSQNRLAGAKKLAALADAEQQAGRSAARCHAIAAGALMGMQPLTSALIKQVLEHYQQFHMLMINEKNESGFSHVLKLSNIGARIHDYPDVVPVYIQVLTNCYKRCHNHESWRNRAIKYLVKGVLELPESGNWIVDHLRSLLSSIEVMFAKQSLPERHAVLDFLRALRERLPGQAEKKLLSLALADFYLQVNLDEAIAIYRDFLPDREDKLRAALKQRARLQKNFAAAIADYKEAGDADSLFKAAECAFNAEKNVMAAALFQQAMDLALSDKNYEVVDYLLEAIKKLEYYDADKVRFIRDYAQRDPGYQYEKRLQASLSEFGKTLTLCSFFNLVNIPVHPEHPDVVDRIKKTILAWIKDFCKATAGEPAKNKADEKSVARNEELQKDKALLFLKAVYMKADTDPHSFAAFAVIQLELQFLQHPQREVVAYSLFRINQAKILSYQKQQIDKETYNKAAINSLLDLALCLRQLSVVVPPQLGAPSLAKSAKYAVPDLKDTVEAGETDDSIPTLEKHCRDICYNVQADVHTQDFARQLMLRIEFYAALREADQAKRAQKIVNLAAQACPEALFYQAQHYDNLYRNSVVGRKEVKKALSLYLVLWVTLSDSLVQKTLPPGEMQRMQIAAKQFFTFVGEAAKGFLGIGYELVAEIQTVLKQYDGINCAKRSLAINHHWNHNIDAFTHRPHPFYLARYTLKNEVCIKEFMEAIGDALGAAQALNYTPHDYVSIRDFSALQYTIPHHRQIEGQSEMIQISFVPASQSAPQPSYVPVPEAKIPAVRPRNSSAAAAPIVFGAGDYRSSMWAVEGALAPSMLSPPCQRK